MGEAGSFGPARNSGLIVRFERRLDQRFDCGTHEILTRREQSFELDNFPFYPQPWSWCAPFTGSVTSNITSMP